MAGPVSGVVTGGARPLFAKWALPLCFAFGVLVCGSGTWFALKKTLPGLDDAKLAIKQRRLAQAESLARGWLAAHPGDVDGMIVLGESLQRQGEIDKAAKVYCDIPFDSGEKAVTPHLAAVSIFLNQGRLADAENVLQKIQIPSNSAHASVADELWVTLLSLSGRRWESMPYLQRTLGTSGELFRTLLYLANPDEMPAPPDHVFAKMFKVADPLGMLGCGRIAAGLGRTEQATRLVQGCLEKRPELIEAHVLQGQLFLDSQELKQFDLWVRQLPKTADAHPSIWFLRGRSAQDAGLRRQAIRCYWEVLRRQPNHDRSTYQLGQLLAMEGDERASNTFLVRAKRLTRLIELAVRMIKTPGSDSENAECARLAYELGRLYECQAWCEYSLSISPTNAEVLELLKKLRKELRPQTPWLLPSADLALQFDFSSYPLPDQNRSRETPEVPELVLQRESSQISFTDDAKRMGLEFVYFNGDDPTSEGKRMFEYTGGGVAAFDYDRDGWCDLYLTQGTAWPPNRSNDQFLDKIFRNVAAERMSDVTALVGIRDASFGQGVSAGDYDNDGFVDLYVANVDGNRLYENRGDGTFADVTTPSGLGREAYWTTSCMIADLDGDGLPDIYDVTFLSGDDVFTRICRDDGGKARSCAPAGFEAALDHVFANQGDGTFRDVTRSWGFDVPNGDGLGVIAADFDDTGTISIFIGNDGRANFFFVPEPLPTGEQHWNEIGLISGLAYDDSGAAQACMGIGAGDANRDGRLDLFVTNFYNESNALYINLGPKTFTDRARSTGIRDPSWSMLGFGTQFVDADLDGWEDLFLVNGHVDDFSHKQIPYKMRPQFFQNQKSRFVERFGREIGPFFDEPRLGRGLARLDWNRDGLNDVAVSQIGDPAALVTNRTRNAGHRIGLTLVGTNRSRDAIGTRVIVKAGETELTRQVIGGDGYQASNERRLDFGLANFQGEVEVEIHWMGGTVETFAHISADHEYLAIEGRGSLLQMR